MDNPIVTCKSRPELGKGKLNCPGKFTHWNGIDKYDVEVFFENDTDVICTGLMIPITDLEWVNKV